MRLLVTGTSGQLAQSLLELGHGHAIDIVAIRRPQLDLTIPSTIAAALADVRPDIVVNAAAYTAVDTAESEPALAMRINATGAGDVATHCQRLGIPIIHLSSDYVFDGTKASPYVETDPTGPQNAYGRSKLAGETAVAASCARHVILRTSWVHSPFGNNFVRTMLRLAETHPQLRVVDDQLGCPTSALDLAAAILQIAPRLTTASAADPVWGTYHATGSGETSWCGFAREIFKHAAARGSKTPELHAIGTADYPTPARRPLNSRLDCSKLQRTFGVSLPDWRHGAHVCIERLLQP